MIISHCPFCLGILLHAEDFKAHNAFCSSCGTEFTLRFNSEINGEEFSMVKLTQSLRKWLYDNHHDKLGLIMFGHTELMTEDMFKEYLKWCETPEGKSYLKGGSNYVEG